jgi:Zn finger protein HypA/HybF involved in hydrogenase expression
MRLIGQPEGAVFIMFSHPRLMKIIDQLSGQAPRSVTVALGELFPLTEEQLRAQWTELVHDTPLVQTKLAIHLITAHQQCMTCFERYHPVNKETLCPHCGSVGAKILAGEELHLESLETEDE